MLVETSPKQQKSRIARRRVDASARHISLLLSQNERKPGSMFFSSDGFAWGTNDEKSGSKTFYMEIANSTIPCTEPTFARG
jgi:hypothetical protein